ncbi:MAG TPA: twin-arginine translocase TatA/TatE family subunit [Polyangia bacterium]|nr:twin-arginine translocase TatA/TatE family subunit [Polyangia bacterium]
MFNLGMGEITVILLLALIFLGPSKLPDLAAGLGKLIKEIRKATSDVKNEIALDDTFRKPFEELRDAVTLHPDELKRRDQWAREREEAAKRAAEEAAREAAAATVDAEGRRIPPDGLADHVQLDEAQKAALQKGEDPKIAAPRLPEPNGPNATIVQTAPPRGATLDDIPTPPPEETVAKAPPPAPAEASKADETPARPSLFSSVPSPSVPPFKGGTPPVGTVARPDTLRGLKPGAANGGAAPAAPPGPDAANTTQILREEDLIPSLSSGTPPPPPHLPGLRPAGAPRPVVTPPLPTTPTDKKKP